MSMRAGLAVLIGAYVLSQFFRAFLAVLAPILNTEIGVTPEDLSNANGWWFIAFALSQLPVGWALDKIGPRRTTAVLLIFGGGGGALLFASATGQLHIQISMILIGIGCSSVLMASFFIIARAYSAAMFATLGGLTIGIGSIGNIAASLPLAVAVETFGWRATMVGLAAITTLVALAVLIIVRDPETPDDANQKGSLLDLLKMPAIWLMLPILLFTYAPGAGIRGSWIGPYLSDIFGQDALGIGRASLIMGLAMIASSLLYGPLDRIFKTRKWVVVVANIITITALFTLAAFPMTSLVTNVALLAIVGVGVGTFSIIMAHGRAFVPPHLLGRGVTLFNLCSIGGAGVMQMISSWRYEALVASGATPAASYSGIFLLFGIAVLVGTIVYLAVQDRVD
ncbi:hypothetical protein RB2150_11101 [Rhodobacteraceae bacterium HTCC2150]|nr:hypothetical protein RB2150_11101 [Rhodobacteraceae bacterium HTCC2150]